MSEPLLRVEGLVKLYAGVRAVDGLSYAVAPGTITGLIGPNGSGKSTSIDCLTGFQPADAGRWWLDGTEVTRHRSHELARLGFTRTFQTVRAYGSLSLIDNLCLAAQAHDRVGWGGAILRSGALREAEGAARRRAAELLELVGLSRLADAPAEILSYGQSKLLAITAAMMAEPRLAVLDEPVAGVNPTMVRRIEDVIGEMRRCGVTFLIVEHNMEFIMRLCQQVIVLESGRKIAEGAPDLIRSDPRVLEAYIGTPIAPAAAAPT